MGYTGQAVTISFGQFGLLTDVTPSELPPNAFLSATNITMTNGHPQKAPGTLKYNTTALTDQIVGMFDYWPDPVKQRLIAATADGKIYRDTGSRGFNLNAAIATGLGTLNPNSMFVEGGKESGAANKKLFFFSDGLNQVKVLNGDGITFVDIENPSTDWVSPNYPTVGLIHRSRLWMFQGQNFYASDAADHENFTSNFLAGQVFPGEGGSIRGAYVFKGRLFAFKDGGFVYYLEDSDTSSANWFWKKLASNFGLSAPNAIVEVINDMLAGNTSGTVTSYAATQKLGDIASADIFNLAQMENYIRHNLNKTGVQQMHAMYYPEKKQAFFTYKTTYNVANNALIVVDFNAASPRIYVWEKGTPQCLGLRKDKNGIERPMYGDASGYVHLMDYEDRSEGVTDGDGSGTAYTGSFRTPFMDFRFVDPTLAQKQKHFDYLSLEFVEEGDWNVEVEVFIDDKFSETLTFPMNIRNVHLDGFELDTDRFTGTLTQTFTQPLHGTGRRISFHVKQAGNNQSFQITSMTVGIRLSGDQATKF